MRYRTILSLLCSLFLQGVNGTAVQHIASTNDCFKPKPAWQVFRLEHTTSNPHKSTDAQKTQF
eukprot:c30207_g1_i1 orf=72-260(+)